jgi:hypothetical protein
MLVSNVANKVMFTFAVLTLGFVAGVYVNKPVAVVHPAPAITHNVNGEVLSDAQFQEQLAIQKAANDKMEADYAATLPAMQAANNTKMNNLIIALAKKAKKDHGLFLVSPVKTNVSL